MARAARGARGRCASHSQTETNGPADGPAESSTRAQQSAFDHVRSPPRPGSGPNYSTATTTCYVPATKK